MGLHTNKERQQEDMEHETGMDTMSPSASTQAEAVGTEAREPEERERREYGNPPEIKKKAEVLSNPRGRCKPLNATRQEC